MRRLSLDGGLCAILAGLCLTGCSGNDEKAPAVLCTTTIVADVVRQVAGPHQSIGVLMAAGVDPHLFDPAPRDARRLGQAKVIFYSGLDLERNMTERLGSLGKSKPVIALTGKLDR